MQKKVLIPVLMAVPAALPAMADIDMGFPVDNWTQGGTTGDENIINLETKEFSCVVGTGYLRQELSLPKGKYKLVFSEQVNVKVVISTDEKFDSAASTEIVPNNNEAEFEVKDGNINTYIKITGVKSAEGFRFTGKELLLVFSGSDAVQAIMDQYNPLVSETLKEVVAEDDFTEAENLRAQLTEIQKKREFYGDVSFETLFVDIINIDDSTIPSEEAIAIYKKYGLDENPSAIEKYLTALGEEIEKYNAAVETENAIWQVYLNNVEARENLIGEQATLDTNIGAVKQEIDGWKVVDENIKNDLIAEADALANEIAEYKTEIDEAYPLDTNRDELRKEITFESKTQKLQDEIDSLKAKFDTRKNDYEKYYNVNYILITELQDAYNKYCDAVKAASGISGYEGVYDSDKDLNNKESKLSVAGTLYNDIKRDNTIPVVEGAVDYNVANKCEENINAAIAKFTADTEAYNTMVETQNNNMNTALGQLGEFTTEIGKFEGLIVPTQFDAEFKEKLTAIKVAVEALRVYVDGQYKGHTLNVDDTSEYGTQVTTIKGLIDELNQFTQPFTVINDLMTLLEKKEAEVKTISDNTAEAVENKVVIADKFSGNFTAFREAINSLDAESANDEAVVEELKEQINNCVVNAQAMSDYFISAYTTIKGYETSLGELVTFVDNKKIGTLDAVINLKEEFKIKYTNEGGQFKVAIVDLWDYYAVVAKKGPNEAYDLIKEFCEETLANSTLVADMEAAKGGFAIEATNANYAYTETKVNELIEAWSAAETAGITNISNPEFVNLDEIAELEEIKSAISAAVAGSDLTNDLAECDKRLENLLKKVAELDQKIKDLTANQEAYDALVGQMNGLQAKLDKVSEENETNSMEPGKSFYKDPVIPAIQTKIDNLNANLLESLQNGSVVADREGEDGYDAKVTALGNEIDATREAINNNNDAHNKQLAEEKRVRTYIERLIAEIDGNDNAEDLDVVTTWLTELHSLIDKDLNDVNIKVTGSYGEGRSAEDNEEIMADYKAIENKAIEIDNAYHGEPFHQAVEAANTITTQGWDQVLSGLWDQYRDGIGTYNTFYYDLENKGWEAFVIPAVKRHVTLFDFYGKITTLTEEETKAVGDWNAQNHVITAEEWQEWLDKANGISVAITDDVNGLLTEADTLAETYYVDLKHRADEAISEAETLLNEAGISLDNLDTAIFYRNQAANLYEGVTEHVSLKMDDIADNLDLVFESIDLQQYAEDAWETKYSEAQVEIGKLRVEITEGYEHAEPEVRAAAIQGFNETVKTIDELNLEVSGVTENLIDKYRSYADNLEALLGTLRGYRDEVERSNDLNVEDQELKNNFDTEWLPGMNEAYDELREYCETLGGCASMEAQLGQIRNTIDVISELVRNNHGRLVELNLEERYNSVMESIANAYEEAFRVEVKYLYQLLDDTKVAFNDAVKNNGTLPEDKTFDGVDAQIEALNSEIRTLHYTEADKVELHAQAIGYEKELCELYAMLQSSWGEQNNPATDILNALNGRYDTIAQAIASGEEALSGCMDSVKEEFSGKYGELKATLDAEKIDWSDDGSHIIARETYYTDALDEIEAEVNALTEDIRVAEESAQAEAEKQRVSNERYDVLKAELDDLNQQFVDAKTLVESYGEVIANMYSPTSDYIEKALNKMSEKLEADKAGFLLTADSELEDADRIEALINDYKLEATRDYAGEILATTGEAAAVASGKLRDLNIVPAQRKVLAEQYIAANDEYQALLIEKRNASFERLGEIITRAEELAEIFRTISEGAVANSFFTGDVDLDGSKDPNVLDVQMLINMIGEGVTYQELYAENARQACAADVTGNENLNVADVTALIQIILGEDFNMVKVSAHKVAPKVEGSISLTLAEEVDGVRRYALALNGGVPFTGGQFDIHVSGTAKVTAVATSARTEAHDAYLFDRGLGDFRVVLASMENAVFEGNDGVIVYIDVEGDGELTVNNALFSDTNNIEHEMGRAHTSAVDAIIDYCKDGAKRIYDAAGRTFNSLQRGINIIVNKDGSVKKELRK